jgi:hypothetical protein
VKTKWSQLSDKKARVIPTKLFRTCCCHCGLVHMWELEPDGISYLVSVDKRSTGGIRGWMKRKAVKR